MPTNIRDVATLAGVSVATTSRALSGNRPVTEENLKRVLAAAAQLGFRPNRLASSLRRQVTDTIGLVIPQISNPFFPELVESLEAYLEHDGRQLLLCDSRHDINVEARRLEALIDRQVDGILISPCDARRSIPAVRNAAGRVPLVQFDRRADVRATDWVGVDDVMGMKLVVDHIAALGASRVQFVGAQYTSSTARSRGDAFTVASAAKGLRAAEPKLGDFSAAWGATAARKVLAERTLPRAIVCGNDLIALGLLRELNTAGVKVPEDVLVTGFDDIMAAELASPSLTTVHQPYEVIVGEAMRLLTERAASPKSPYRRLAVPPTLVVRQSA